MIEVTATYCDGEYDFNIKGHAGYNAGNDIVCAGMSGIAYTLLGMLDYLEAEYDSIEEPGDLRIVMISDNEDVKQAFRMALIGFAQIQKSYSRYVRVEQSGFF